MSVAGLDGIASLSRSQALGIIRNDNALRITIFPFTHSTIQPFNSHPINEYTNNG